MVEQCSQVSEQVGLGWFDVLVVICQLVDQIFKLGILLIYVVSVEYLMLFMLVSQVFVVNQIGVVVQGWLELVSVDQIWLYVKQGIIWYIEGVDCSGGGQGGVRMDVISYGSDQVQVQQGVVQFLVYQDIVLEFCGESGMFGMLGVSFVFMQGGVLIVIGNMEVVSEVVQYVIGGVLDWWVGSGMVVVGLLVYWGKMDVKDVCVECLLVWVW